MHGAQRAIPVPPPVAASDARHLNDRHSKLNPCLVDELASPTCVADVLALLARARSTGRGISIGGRLHSMGGQPYGAGTIHLSGRGFDHIGEIDARHGTIDVGSGVTWAALVPELVRRQAGATTGWGIIQKQTGADDLSIGGSLGSNIHGRGLALRPFAHDVAGFEICLTDATVRWCTPDDPDGLFGLVAGGYGLFGVVTRVRLKLQRRHAVERRVEVIGVADLASRVEERVRDGFTYGDLQFVTDESSEDFMRAGVFSCYRPAGPVDSLTSPGKALSAADWQALMVLAHTDKARAWALYREHYLATDGQRYASDEHQLSLYLDDYHTLLDLRARTGAAHDSSEMILEVYVPPERLGAFMEDVRADFLEHGVNLIYGTIRFIRADRIGYLAWARRDLACIVVNLNVTHDEAGIARARGDFRRLIDRAIEHDGSFYLTYHTWATAEQVRRCHPRFESFLEHKRRLDPDELIQSDWYRHHRRLLAP